MCNNSASLYQMFSALLMFVYKPFGKHVDSMRSSVSNAYYVNVLYMYIQCTSLYIMQRAFDVFTPTHGSYLSYACADECLRQTACSDRAYRRRLKRAQSVWHFYSVTSLSNTRTHAHTNRSACVLCFIRFVPNAWHPKIGRDMRPATVPRSPRAPATIYGASASA